MKLCRIFFACMLLAFPAFASEDGEAYNESIDFSFDNPNDAVWMPSSEEDEEDVLPPEGFLADDVMTKEQAKQFSKDTNKNNNNTSDKPKQNQQSVEPKEEQIFLPPKPNIQTENPTTAKKDDKKDSSLTDELKKTDPEKRENIIEGTWIEKLTELSPSKLLGSENDKKSDNEKETSENSDEYYDDADSDIEGMMRNYRQKTKNGKSNASVFDIAGVMLRMNPQQAEDILTNRGFKKINAKFQIPNFIKWRNEEKCRNSGIVGYERTQACVIQKAKKDGFEYVQYMKFAKFETKEELEFYLTSNFTGNKIYKIEYRSLIASINGNSPKAIYIRNLKIYDFWRRINRKYGVPDDKNMVTWGLGGNKPYLKANTGWLKLEDPMFVEMDYTRMSQEDKRFINSDFYNF
ncbi:MAG: hypothetical protein IKK52_00410 [Alphaproteobacteria bacterium]|nr:hypothetical protein [Alphaproteobacteria bacterium]